MKHFHGAFWSFTACGHQPLSLQCSCKLEHLTKLLLCCITEEKKPNGAWKLWQISFFRWPVPWNIRELNKIESVRLVVQQRSAATLAVVHGGVVDRPRPTDTYQQAGRWWDMFLWACRAWVWSHWTRTPPQPPSGPLSAGTAKTVSPSVSPVQE